MIRIRKEQISREQYLKQFGHMYTGVELEEMGYYPQDIAKKFKFLKDTQNATFEQQTYLKIQELKAQLKDELEDYQIEICEKICDLKKMKALKEFVATEKEWAEEMFENLEEDVNKDIEEVQDFQESSRARD